MAKSGSKSVAVTSYDTLKFSWTESSQSITNNTTTISWKLQLITTEYGKISSTASKDWSVTVNGTKYSGTNTVGIGASSTKTLASGTTTIAHNSDGTKTFSYSFSQEFAITFSGSYVGTKSGSGTGTLDTIARASSFGTVTGNTIGSNMTVNITRNSTSFTHQLWYKVGNSAWVDLGTGIGTSKTFQIDPAMASQFPKATSGILQLCLRTFNGTTQVGSDVYKNVTVNVSESVVPSVSFTVSDENGYFSTYGAYIQGKSAFNIAITASGNRGSTIESYKTTVDGKTYTDDSITTDVVAGSGTLKINVTVTDSRGRTATATKDLTVLAYAVPKITAIKAERCDGSGNASSSGTHLKVTFNASITSLNSKNGATYTLYYKKISDSSYEDIPLSDYSGSYVVTDGSYVFTADTTSSYDVCIRATDNFISIDKYATGSSVKKLWSWLKNNLGIAFGKVAETENLFECEFDAQFNGKVTIPNTIAGGNLPVARSTFTSGEATIADFAPTSPTFIGTVYEEVNASWKNLISVRHRNGDDDGKDYGMMLYSAMAIDGNLAWKQQLGASTWGYEKVIFDSSNYPIYVVPKTGGAFTGAIFVTNAGKSDWNDKKIGCMLSETGYMTLQHATYPQLLLYGGSDIENFGEVSLTPSKNLLLTSSKANVVMQNSTGQLWFASDRFRSNANDTYYLGDSANKWKAVYAVNGTIQTSDRNQKENIVEIGQKYEELFNRLRPVTFELKGSEHDRVHIGLIAQDVKESMDEIGLTDRELSAYCVDIKTEFDEEKNEYVEVLDENGEPFKMYSLRYTEFIALNTHMIQKQQEKIDAQQKEIDALKQELAGLKELIKSALS